MSVTVEFTVEPFTDGTPGRHVDAAQAAVRDAGVELEVGPFGSAFTCPTEQAGPIIDRLTVAAVAAGATRISVQVTVDGS